VHFFDILHNVSTIAPSHSVQLSSMSCSSILNTEVYSYTVFVILRQYFVYSGLVYMQRLKNKTSYKLMYFFTSDVTWTESVLL